MIKKWLLASTLVFFAWQAMDFVLHGIILQPTYEATANLWRPMAEMYRGLMIWVALVCALVFAGIYAWMVSPKSPATGLRYGLLYGLAAGLSMGFGSYSYMPIPIHLAIAWFLGTLVEMTAAGAITGAIVRQPEHQVENSGDCRPSL